MPAFVIVQKENVDRRPLSRRIGKTKSDQKVLNETHWKDNCGDNLLIYHDDSIVPPVVTGGLAKPFRHIENS